MLLEDAKLLILGATESGAWVARGCDNSFVRTRTTEHHNDPVVLEALELLFHEGVLEQLPTSGQSRTEVCYKRTDQTI